MSRPNKGNHRKEKRQQEAKERQEAYNKLSNSEKLAQLDKTFGKNKGAARQRARLNK